MPFLFLRAFTSTKTRIMKANGEMGAEDYAQIKKLCLTLTIDDIKDDIIKLVELVKKNHPNGVSFLEDVKADFSDNDNPKFKYKFPEAISLFQEHLNSKYANKVMRSAVFVNVIHEVFIKKNFDSGIA